MSTAKAKSAVAVAATAEAAAQHVEQVVAVGKETLETVVKASADAASKGYEKAVALTKDHVETASKVHTAAFRSYEDAVTLGRDNLDAVVRAGTILTRGLQDIGKLVVGLTQETVEETVAASRQMMGAKSLKEVIDLQAGLARSNLDKVLEEGARLSDLSVKLAEEAFAPLGERLTATVERLGPSA